MRHQSSRSNHRRTKESSEWWTVVSKSDQLHFLKPLVDIRKGGNKIKKWESFSCSELKHLFTYSPIHSLQLQNFGIRVEIKWKMDNFFLVRVKTPIHLFTYSLFASSKLWKKGGNKTKKWKTFSWSELKHLFTYSPIHLFTAFLPSGDLGICNQNCAKTFTSTRIGRMRLKPSGQQPTPNCAAVTLICWYTANCPVELQRSFDTCSIVLEIKRKNVQRLLGPS